MLRYDYVLRYGGHGNAKICFFIFFFEGETAVLSFLFGRSLGTRRLLYYGVSFSSAKDTPSLLTPVLDSVMAESEQKQRTHDSKNM